MEILHLLSACQIIHPSAPKSPVSLS